MIQTDKSEMERIWNNIYNDFKSAEEYLLLAKKILESSFIVNDSGYEVNKINNIKDRLYDFRDLVDKRIIPTIRNM